MDEHRDDSSDAVVLNCRLDTLAILGRAGPDIIDDLHRQLTRHAQRHFTCLAKRAAKLIVEFAPDPTTPATTAS